MAKPSNVHNKVCQQNDRIADKNVTKKPLMSKYGLKICVNVPVTILSVSVVGRIAMTFPCAVF